MVYGQTFFKTLTKCDEAFLNIFASSDFLKNTEENVTLL